MYIYSELEHGDRFLSAHHMRIPILDKKPSLNMYKNRKMDYTLPVYLLLCLFTVYCVLRTV